MISYNLGQNICRSFHFLPQFLFTTSETELDYHQKVNVRVSSRVTEQIKTQDLRKLRNFKKTPETLGSEGDYSVGTPKSQILTFFGIKLHNISCKTFHKKS